MAPSSPILVSGCLVGLNCRYDARLLAMPPEIETALKEGRVVSFCPEEAGGLGTPREPAGIENGKTGADVLDGRARVVTASGRDVTAEFVKGAQGALELARARGVRRAYLKTKSPSCGIGGLRRLDGELEPGDGVTAALLRRHGIEVLPLDAPRI